MKKYIFLLVLLICTNTGGLMASDFASTKKSAQKELSQVTVKRDKAQQKQSQLEADYAETLSQIEALKEKPKSLAYKNAVKKSESLNAIIEKNKAELDKYNQDIESLTKVIAECETEMQASHQAKENELSVKDEEHAAIEREEEVVEEPKEEPASPIVATKDDNTVGKNEVSSPKTSEGDSSEEDNTMIFLIIFIIVILYIIYKIIKWVRWHKCPKCKKKWALKVIDEQDCGIAKKEKVKKQDGTHEWVYYHKIKVTRECKHCGYQVWHTEVRKEA